ncbi:MAG: hypothetical protein R3B47_15240 [Bacteroidia bacterium]
MFARFISIPMATISNMSNPGEAPKSQPSAEAAETKTPKKSWFRYFKRSALGLIALVLLGGIIYIVVACAGFTYA